MASKAGLVRRESLEDPRHLMRYLKFHALAGTESERIAEIAKIEHVSFETIRISVHKIERYRGANSQPEMEFAIRDLVISAIPKAKETLDGLLGATEFVEVGDDKRGRKRIRKQEDKTTRLEAMKIVNSLIGSVQPKQPPITVNNNQTNQTATVISTAETPEERLRRLRAKHAEANALPPEVVGVPEYIDQDIEPETDSEEEDEPDDEE